MGSCRCCKRDPNRACKPCFLIQEWRTYFPPDQIVTFETDSLLDNLGAENTTGDCSSFLDRNYSHVWTNDYFLPFDDDLPLKDGEGNFFPRTTTTDLQSPVEFYKTRNSQLIANGRLYRFQPVNIGGARFEDLAGNPIHSRGVPSLGRAAIGTNCFGYYHVPNSAIVNRTYSKTFDGSFGGDFYSWDPEILEKVWRFVGEFRSGVFAPYRLATFSSLFNTIGFDIERTFAPPVLGGRPELTKMADRKIVIRDFSESEGSGRGFGKLVLNFTMADYWESGLQFRINEESATEEGVLDCKLTILNTGDVFEYQRTSGFNRCRRPVARLQVQGGYKLGGTSVFGQLDPNLYDFPNQNGAKWLICSPVDLSWFFSTTDLPRLESPVVIGPALMIGWIGLLSVDGTNSDTALFGCKQVDLYRHNSGKPFLTVVPEQGEYTIADGTIIDFDAGFNDRYVVTFDNPTIHTTEVSNVTFQAPLVTGVDRTTETFTGFERNSFEFTGADPDGLFPPAGLQTSNLVFTHDNGGSLIPSPFTITLRSSKGVTPS